MEPVKVFFCYSKADLDYKQQAEERLRSIEEHLRPNVRSDFDIAGGSEWDPAIMRMIEESELVVLLLSHEFLETPYVKANELPLIGRLLKKEQLQVYPILARFGDGVLPLPDWLPARQIKPSDTTGLSEMDPSARDEALEQIAKELQGICRDLAIPFAPELDLEWFRTHNSDQDVDLDMTLHHRDWDCYRAELRVSYRSDSKKNHVLPYYVTINRTDIEERYKSDPRGLGRLLGRELFPEALESDAEGRPVMSPPLQILTDALRDVSKPDVRGQTGRLHLRIGVSPSAQELHRVCWEHLSDPTAGEDSALSRNPDVGFSRHVLGFGENWREVRLRRKQRPNEELRALVVISERRLLADSAEVDEAAELRAEAAYRRAALCVHPVGAGSIPRFKGHELCDLRDELLQRPVDILYLVCRWGIEIDEDSHPRRRSFLEFWKPADAGDATREPERFYADELTECLSTLRVPPRLVVLDGPLGENGNDFESGVEPALIEAATAIAKSGVAAVLVSQAAASPGECTTFQHYFFAALREVESADLAATMARRMLYQKDREEGRTRTTWWRVALLTRMRSARIWYTPQLTVEGTRLSPTWDSLRASVNDGTLLPVIGPGLTSDIAGSNREIARRWAFNRGFPLGYHELMNLPRVAQYIKVNFGDRQLAREVRETLRELIFERNQDRLPSGADAMTVAELFTAIGGGMDHPATVDDREVKRARTDLYQMLAELDLPIYVVGSMNEILFDRVKVRHAEAQLVKFRKIARTQIGGGKQHEFPSPESDQPWVFHMFGTLSDLEEHSDTIGNTTLTEDEYFDFLIDFARVRGNPFISQLGEAFLGRDVVFLGFKHYQLTFLTLLHSLRKLPGVEKARGYTQIAVQIDPDDDFTIDPEGARAYLQQLLRRKDVEIYWGTPEDFLNELVGERK